MRCALSIPSRREISGSPSRNPELAAPASGLRAETKTSEQRIEAGVGPSSSRYPLLRSVEAMATSIPLFLVVFATTHYLLNELKPGNYPEPMTRLDPLYFTTSTFATVGFGARQDRLG